MGVVSFWIKTVSGRGMPDRYRGRMFKTMKGAIKAAARHHKGDYQIGLHIDEKAARVPVTVCPTCQKPL